MNRIRPLCAAAAAAVAGLLTIAAEQPPQPPQSPPTAAAAPAAFDLRMPVSEDNGPQDVNVLQREFPVGATSGWHVHPGVEIGYLLSGEMELRTEGTPPRRLRPGDHFVMPRGMEHNGINVGTTPALVMITYVVDRGAAVRTAVAAPE